jgi:serine/threonine protein kinase/exonuclease VII small subunit
MKRFGIDYHRDSMPLDLWRKVIAATLDFGMALDRGGAPAPEDFASGYPDIPSDVLTPQLERMQQEFQADQVPQRLLVSSSPSVFTERYTVMELLRSGGMGDIYLGFDKECRRPVAIKKIRKDLMGNREARFRFHAEAELTAGLEHPGIIPIYGRGVDADGREFYVMRLIAGDGSGTLADAIRRFHAVHGEYSQAHPRLNGQRLDELRDLLRRLKQVADAVAYAHSEGIVHRDLKPSNILCGVFGETWIGDWGLARHFIKSDRMEGGETYSLEDTQSLERQNDFPPATTGIGTPGYSAPELTQGGLQVWLPGVDIYSLGAILSCILHGSPAAPGHWPDDRSIQVPGRLSLQAICDKAMADDPAVRYQTAEGFRDDLQRWVVGDPVTARREGLWERSLQWPRRRPLAATALASTSLIVVALGSFFLWVQSRQRKILELQTTQLGQALADAAKLVQENRIAKLDAEKSRGIAELKREDAERHRRIAEKREALAFDGMFRFQNLLISNHQVFRNPGLSRLHDRLRKDSKDILENLLSETEVEGFPTEETISGLSAITHSIVGMESLLQEYDEASRLIDRACDWMAKFTDRKNLPLRTRQVLLFRLLELKSLQGSHWMRLGDFERCKQPLHEAIALMEEIDESLLSDEEQLAAYTANVKAISALSMHYYYAGDQATAKKLQKDAIDRLRSGEPQSYHDAMTRVQVHFNKAILAERDSDPETALTELEMASVAAEQALARIGETPGGIRFEGADFQPTEELLQTRAQLVLDRARLLLAEKDDRSAYEVLSRFREKELNILLKMPQDQAALDSYQRVSTFLQSIQGYREGYAPAKQTSKEWIRLARFLQEQFPDSPSIWMFLIQAVHIGGHLDQQFQQPDAAIESYREGMRLCDAAFQRQIRTSNFVYQKLELELHVFCMQVDQLPLAEIAPIWERATQLAEELLATYGDQGPQVQLARKQLMMGLTAMKEAGYQAEMEKWEAELRQKMLLP